jgi:hypothetical protein
VKHQLRVVFTIYSACYCSNLSCFSYQPCDITLAQQQARSSTMQAYNMPKQEQH